MPKTIFFLSERFHLVLLHLSDHPIFRSREESFIWSPYYDKSDSILPNGEWNVSEAKSLLTKHLWQCHSTAIYTNSKEKEAPLHNNHQSHRPRLACMGVHLPPHPRHSTPSPLPPARTSSDGAMTDRSSSHHFRWWRGDRYRRRSPGSSHCTTSTTTASSPGWRWRRWCRPFTSCWARPLSRR